jgi:transposase
VNDIHTYISQLETTPELQAVVAPLLEYIAQLESRLNAVLQENHDLKARVKLNSTNSHQPPSSDGLRKRTVPKNNREKTGRPPGAQTGHPGTTLAFREAPDTIIEHKVEHPCRCGHDLRAEKVKKYLRRQVYDLPALRIHVTEHRIEVKECPHCHQLHEAACEVSAAVQYGDHLKAFSVYLTQYQLLPFERTQEFYADLFGFPLSDGVLQDSNATCYEGLAEIEHGIKEHITCSEVIHNDETGIRCDQKTQWIHTNSTPEQTLYTIHPKRGREALDAINILPTYTGVSVHDRYASYDGYPCQHALCNAHLLRDLQRVSEDDQKDWAIHMKDLLLDAKALSEQVVQPPTARYEIFSQYDAIVQTGLLAEPPPAASTAPVAKRGKQAKSKSQLLLEVFQSRKEHILRFLVDPHVPFDNNQAERDLRMIKLKQKISGCFRTKKGAEIFCRIRSFISTVKKQHLPVFHSIVLVLQGQFSFA